MGFSSRLSKGADADLADRFKKELELAAQSGDEDDVVATPASPAPARDASGVFRSSAQAPTSRPTSFGQSPASPQAEPPSGRPTSFGQSGGTQASRPTRPTSFGGSSDQPANSNTGRPTSFGGRPGTSRPGSVTSAPPASPRAPISFRSAPSEHGKQTSVRVASADNMRLDRLIEEVSAYRNASPQEIEKLRQNVAKNPETLLFKLQEIYEKEVKPFKEKNVTEMATARIRHPGDAVFMISVGPKQKLHVIPRAQAESNGLSLLDGAHIVCQNAEGTPFARPAELFGVGAGIRQTPPSTDQLNNQDPVPSPRSSGMRP